MESRPDQSPLATRHAQPSVAVPGDANESRLPSWGPSRRHLTPDERTEAEEVYAMFDLQAVGMMTLRPLKMAFRALGIKLRADWRAVPVRHTARHEEDGPSPLHDTCHRPSSQRNEQGEFLNKMSSLPPETPAWGPG